MLEELSRPYGCYGIKTIDGFSAWLDPWIINGGDQHCLEGFFMVINKTTHHFTMWNTEEITG